MKKINVSRTNGEWEAIEAKIKELGKKDVNSYLRCEIYKLKKRFDENPISITSADGIIKIKQYYMPDTTYDTIKLIALKMKKPVATVVDEFIINPLLTQRMIPAL